MTFRRTRCPSCKGKLEQGQRIHIFCIDAYAESEAAKAQRKAEKQARMAAKVERVETRRRKDEMKSHGELLAEAQKEFNAFIRERDKDKGCFVCGKPFPDRDLGGSFDAGHVRSRGAAGQHRFNESNCMGECKECNSSWGAKPHQIKAGAIARIGVEQYEALENDNTPRKWTKDELRTIKAEYRAKTKELKKDAK